MRLSYSKLFNPTDTRLSIAAYRYSPNGYLSLRDAITTRDPISLGPDDPALSRRLRSQLQLTIHQPFPTGLGSFYFSGSTLDYGHQAGRTTQFQAGYNNYFRQINYGLSLERQYDSSRCSWDNRAMLNVSISLGRSANAPYLSTSLQRDSGGATQLQQSLSGSLGTDSAFSYGLSATRASQPNRHATTDAAVNLSYRASATTLTASASSGKDFRQFGAGMSGGVIGYRGGLVLAPYMSDTVAVVEAKDAGGARIAGGSGLRLDSGGRVIIPNLLPFSKNEVEIDPKGLPMSVELKSTMQRTAPTTGAVVRLRFQTEGGGRAVMIRARQDNGEVIPFGAQVTDSLGEEVGTVAQAGRILVDVLSAMPAP